MTMNANSSLATYGQLPETLACAEQVEGLHSRVAEMAARWWKDSDGFIRDITVGDFHTDGQYRIVVDFGGTPVTMPNEVAADNWIERMVKGA